MRNVETIVPAFKKKKEKKKKSSSELNFFSPIGLFPYKNIKLLFKHTIPLLFKRYIWSTHVCIYLPAYEILKLGYEINHRKDIRWMETIYKKMESNQTTRTKTRD